MRQPDISKDVQQIVSQIAALPDQGGRRLIAIAGPPGAGKSTLAEAVTQALCDAGTAAVLMPMDGFHLDNRLLDPMGLLPRKGAPETFDFAGFATCLRRVKAGEPVYLPIFDRSREIAIAGAAEITAATQTVVVEGNYLCFDEAPWNGLADLWDFSVFLDVPVPELERRLIARWLDHGYAPDEAHAKAMGNDIPNARRVAGAVLTPDYVLHSPDPASG